MPTSRGAKAAFPHLHVLSQIDTLAKSVASERDANAVWATAALIFQKQIGHSMFTVMRYDESAGTVTRIYSDRPGQYPVGGAKAMGPTPWGEHVLHHGQPFIGNDAEAIRWAFPDHALLASIGMESVLNLPIRVAGTTLGTINLSHGPGHYEENHVEAGMMFAAVLTPMLRPRTIDKHPTEATG